MELREYIEAGIKKAGTGRELARILDMGSTELADAKGHRRGLPNHAICKLADYLGLPERPITAASELVTEKKEEKRAYWRPFVEHARAATVALLMSLLIVTNFVTPTPAEAAPALKVQPEHFVLCKVGRVYRRNNRTSKQRQLLRRLKAFLESFVPSFAPWSFEG